MVLAGKLTTELGIKEPGDKFFNLFATQLHDVQNICERVHATKLHEGDDWHGVGKSVKHWTYVVDATSYITQNASTEFENEVDLLGKIQHSNIVSLLGCSFNGDTRCIVYELMENGSLELGTSVTWTIWWPRIDLAYKNEDCSKHVGFVASSSRVPSSLPNNNGESDDEEFDDELSDHIE